MNSTPNHPYGRRPADDLRAVQERYRELVRRKDPATMEKRRLASTCPVCGERFVDGGHPFREGRGDLGSDLAVSGGGSGVRFPSPDDPSLPERIDGHGGADG